MRAILEQRWMRVPSSWAGYYFTSHPVSTSRNHNVKHFHPRGCLHMACECRSRRKEALICSGIQKYLRLLTWSPTIFKQALKDIWLGLIVLLPFSALAQGISPTNLLCEAKSNPIGLSETSPRLSWQDAATV